jgi:hypothetical protein
MNQTPTEESNPYRNNQQVGLMNLAPTKKVGLINQILTL